MTRRLEEALKQLTAEQLEHVTRVAEHMATSARAPVGKPTFSWFGALKDSPERSGVEAVKRAHQIRIELLNKSRPK
jgi:hypothetical protein